MRCSVRLKSSRISASSSTISTRLLFILFYHSLTQHRKLRPRGGFDELQLGIVGLAHFAREVKPKTGAAADRGEERLEQLVAQRRGHAWPVVYHVQFYNGPAADQIDGDADARLAAAAMPQCVAAEIPHHLIQIAAIERDFGVDRQLERDQGSGLFFDLAELLDEGFQI